MNEVENMETRTCTGFLASLRVLNNLVSRCGTNDKQPG